MFLFTEIQDILDNFISNNILYKYPYGMIQMWTIYLIQCVRLSIYYILDIIHGGFRSFIITNYKCTRNTYLLQTILTV